MYFGHHLWFVFTISVNRVKWIIKGNQQFLILEYNVSETAMGKNIHAQTSDSNKKYVDAVNGYVLVDI